MVIVLDAEEQMCYLIVLCDFLSLSSKLSIFGLFQDDSFSQVFDHFENILQTQKKQCFEIKMHKQAQVYGRPRQ